MGDNHRWPGQRLVGRNTSRSGDSTPAIPIHMHAPSMDFDSNHSRNQSAALRSPFGTPELAIPRDHAYPDVMTFPDFSESTQSDFYSSNKDIEIKDRQLLDLAPDKPPLAFLGDPGPIAPVPKDQYSTGLTPLLQSSPYFLQNAFQPQRPIAKQEQDDFAPPPNIDSSTLQDNADAFLFPDTSSQALIKAESESTNDSKRLSMQDDEPSELMEPPMKRRETVASGRVSSNSGLLPLIGDYIDNGSVFNIPSNDYGDPLTTEMQWTEEDNSEIKKLLEDAERVKWNYMSDRMFEAIGKRIPPSACHRKFLDLFGVSENTTILGSSLNYIAYRNGWSVISNVNVENPNFIPRN